jgi:hypothetical protein
MGRAGGGSGTLEMSNGKIDPPGEFLRASGQLLRCFQSAKGSLFGRR